METPVPNRKPRFGAFEVDLRAGELRKHGVRLKLQGQPFHVLAVLLEQPGEVVSREELRQKLWPADTFVDFDTGLNSAVKKLRDVLADSAEEPRYIETLPKRGYRFIAALENGAGPRAAEIIQEAVALVVPAEHASELKSQPPPERWIKRRSIATAVVAILLIGAALAAWRVLVARPALNNTDVIVLANFVNNTGDPIFDNSLDKALEVKLAESPFLSILPDADMRAAMRMMRRDPHDLVTRDVGLEICKRQGLKAVVVPEIAGVGGRYVITLEAIDARNQKSLARRQEEVAGKDQVIAALGKAGSELRRRLGESLSSLEKYNAPLDLATTSSLEALQAYRTGQNLYRAGKRREAAPFFERAVEVDPQFCSAYSMLGSVYHSTSDEQASRKNFAKAFELKDRRLTQEENFQSTALYHMAITGNLEKAAAVLVLYKEAYPRRAFANNVLGINYAQQGRTEEALQEFEWAIGHSPVPSAQHFSNASQALMILGRFDETKRMLDRWRHIGTLTPFETVMLYRIAFIENDAATMEKMAREIPADDASWLESQMQFAFLRGDIGKLRSVSEALVNQQSQAKQMEDVAHALGSHAGVESFLGNYGMARQLCRRAAEAGNDSALGIWLCAKTLAEAGDTKEASELAAKLVGLFPEDTFQQQVLLPIARSIIERKRGNLAKAVELLDPIPQYPNVAIAYHRAEAYVAAGEHEKAAGEFEKILDHRGWPEWEIFAPLAQLGLARSYAMQGERGESRKAYDEFFKTWKDADADIPILREAKMEYRKLGAPPH
jgi:DNA-binding winged helix-turn-helix (wHTH) protein/Tfp pilus assembly protein PilF